MANQSYDDIESAAEMELDALLNDSQLDSNVDIDKTLNDKAKKNQLTKINVKNLIKNVLTNDDVATMLRQTLDDYEDANCLYEPKFTRAKIKEMLKTYPPSVHQWSTNQQESIISECRLLIDKEFPDDSEDEEYHPDKALDYEDDDDDDEESKCTEINKSFETEGEPENDVGSSANKTVIDSNDKETIGMRTRSKFSLNDTPLEIIEQAFIPPDITEDMYDSACENDEWREFLSQFTKPLEPVQNDDVEDDPEYNVLCDDDLKNVDKEEFRMDKQVKVTRREYNELMNELYEITESYIQFNGCEALVPDTVIAETVNNKKNKSQNTSPTHDSNYPDWKLNATCSYTNDKNIVKPTNPDVPITVPISISIPIPVDNSNYSDFKLSSTCPTNDAQTANCSTQLNVPQYAFIHNTYEVKNTNYVLQFTQPILNPQSNDEQDINGVKGEFTSVNNSDNQCVTNAVQARGMTQKQIILFKHQLTQHSQLVTQSHILSPKEKKYRAYRKKLKGFLEVIKNITRDKEYEPINIHTSLKFIEEWIDVFESHSEDTIIKEDICLPSIVKEFMLLYKSPVFIYPELLPTKTFHFELRHFSIKPLSAEEKYFVLKIDSVCKKLKESPLTRVKYRKMDLTDMMPFILPIVHKRWFSHRKLSDLKGYVTRRKMSFRDSIIKNYFINGKIEETVHVIDIGALFIGKCLYEYDVHKFPSNWKTFVNNILSKKKKRRKKK